MKKRFIALFFTVLIFVLIFRSINFHAFLDSLYHLNYGYLMAALAYFLIYPFIGIERWRSMVNIRFSLKFWEAFKIYFIGESLNLALPSKAGDLSKGYFLKKAGVSSFSYGLSTVVFEKLLDLLSLGFAFIIGFLLIRGGGEFIGKTVSIIVLFALAFIFFILLDKMRFLRVILYKFKFKKMLRSFREIISFVRIIKKDHHRILFFSLILVSILFWLGHLFQIWLFFKAANMDITYIQVLFYVPIAIFVALVPITIAGMGTRDAMLIFLLQSFIPRETIVLGGLLITLRYFIPASFGLLFIKDAVEYIKIKKSALT